MTATKMTATSMTAATMTAAKPRGGRAHDRQVRVIEREVGSAEAKR
ncbi:hypothetical protein [Methylobacterium sp. A54F]